MLAGERARRSADDRAAANRRCDACAGRGSRPLRFRRSTRSVRFAFARRRGATPRRRVPAGGDIDGDSDTEVVVTAGLGVRLLQNRGAAGFVDVGSLPGVMLGSLIHRLVSADLDGDVDWRLLLTRFASAELALFTNDGLGTFTAAPAVLLQASSFASDLAATDVDRDGDPDLVVTE